MKIDVVAQVTVEDTEFLLSLKDGWLTIADGIQGTELATYNTHSVPVETVAQDIPARIVEYIAKPHMILETSEELLKFYLLLMNVVNMFYLFEFTSTQTYYPGE